MKKRYDGDQVCLFMAQNGFMIHPSARKKVESAPFRNSSNVNAKSIVLNAKFIVLNAKTGGDVGRASEDVAWRAFLSGVNKYDNPLIHYQSSNRITHDAPRYLPKTTGRANALRATGAQPLARRTCRALLFSKLIQGDMAGLRQVEV